MDWAEERTGVMRKSSETLSSFIAKSFHGVSCVSFFVRYVMSIGSRKDARMIVLASLPWDFAQGWKLEITEPELSELLFQGLPDLVF